MNLPQIPSTFHQVSLLISFLLFFAFAYTDRENDQIRKGLNDQQDRWAEVFDKDALSLHAREAAVWQSMIKVANDANCIQFVINDSVNGSFKFMLDSVPGGIVDTAFLLNQNAKRLAFEEKKMMDTYKMRLERYNREMRINGARGYISLVYFITASLCLIVGLIMLAIYDRETVKFKLHELGIEKMQPKRPCQSCGRKLNTVLTSGTNRDRSINDAFCIECYKLGQFVEPEVTVEIMIERAMNSERVRSCTRRGRALSDKICLLNRWHKNQY